MGRKKQKIWKPMQMLTERDKEEILNIPNLYPMLNAMRQHLEDTNVKQSVEKKEDMVVLDKKAREDDIAFAHKNLCEWVDKVKDPNDIDDVKGFIEDVTKELDSLVHFAKFRVKTKSKPDTMDYALLEFWESGLTDLSGFDGLCTIDDARKVKIQTMANTLKLHDGVTEKESADSEKMEVIYISDESDAREEKGTKINTEDSKPLSEEEEDWGEMEEVSDDEEWEELS
ncbi:hypothetical protein GUITHDRAFT_148839 [Guillardia theta CCMP2712]|uniref:Uncharacterized protein n=1 Tax=Guillardia theta (strain CCMP2712) TaxID=905079 RepID=L1I8D9_GUITC|nr:hypothetical protein GUITHDRAFT_148839 [Guillardia theta CCMP2712]EKX32120.1 hypothetical protein GUITHDRAFT_148839 [Guillardia theta CCMP2712]|eukprot:XP_005819100.1 hypothetical protein GUITHDRAFT_148839 [Guillardia theta CCMP2712]